MISLLILGKSLLWTSLMWLTNPSRLLHTSYVHNSGAGPPSAFSHFGNLHHTRRPLAEPAHPGGIRPHALFRTRVGLAAISHYGRGEGVNTYSTNTLPRPPFPAALIQANRLPVQMEGLGRSQSTYQYNSSIGLLSKAAKIASKVLPLPSTHILH